MVKKSDGSLCAQCTALCCHYITVDIDEPLTNQARDDVRWYLLHEGVTLLIEKDRWLLQIATPAVICKKTTAAVSTKNAPKPARTTRPKTAITTQSTRAGKPIISRSRTRKSSTPT